MPKFPFIFFVFERLWSATCGTCATSWGSLVWSVPQAILKRFANISCSPSFLLGLPTFFTSILHWISVVGFSHAWITIFILFVLQAVVNEDTQGNVSHLQAEIRKLKDQLASFQAGNVPRPIPGTVGFQVSKPFLLVGGGSYFWLLTLISPIGCILKSEMYVHKVS